MLRLTGARTPWLQYGRRWSTSHSSNHTTTGTGYRVLFFGTDKFSVPSLAALHQAFTNKQVDIDALEVVTPPARRTGRGRKLHVLPVQAFAEANHLPVHYPPPGTLADWSAPKTRSGDPFNLAVAVSFGYFLPRELLATFAHGGLNVHPSLLPRYRGPAPLQHTILDGLTETGVTVQELDPHRFDAGRILGVEHMSIKERVTYPELEKTLAERGAKLLIDTIADLPRCKQNATVQDATQVTKAPKLSRTIHHIQWDQHDAAYLERLHRAIGAKTPLVSGFRKSSVQLHGDVTVADPPNAPTSSTPGMVIFTLSRDALYIRCHTGWLHCSHVQVAGKRVVSVREWINGYSVQSGSVVFHNL